MEVYKRQKMLLIHLNKLKWSLIWSEFNENWLKQINVDPVVNLFLKCMKNVLKYGYKSTWKRLTRSFSAHQHYLWKNWTNLLIRSSWKGFNMSCKEKKSTKVTKMQWERPLSGESSGQTCLARPDGSRFTFYCLILETSC